MWLCTVYLSTSQRDTTKQVVRVHGIGTPAHVKMEMRLGTLELGDPNILAVVQCLSTANPTEQTARDIAQYYADQLGLEVEI